MGLTEFSEFQCLPNTACCGINPKNDFIVLRLCNVVAFIAMVAFNGLSVSGVFGESQKAVSDSHPTYFTPSGAAFSIWGLIYALMALYIVYQALPVDWPKQKNTEFLFEEIGWLFVSQAVLNSLWIIVFSQSSLEPGSDKAVMWIAAVIIACLLINLLWIYVKIQKNREELNYWEMLSLMVGWTIYTAWVTAATILNISTALWTSGINKSEGYDEETGAIIMICIALVIYMATTWIKADPIYGLTFAWVTFWQADSRGSKVVLYADYTTYSQSVQLTDYIACGIIVGWALLVCFWQPGRPWGYLAVWGAPARKNKSIFCCGGDKRNATAELEDGTGRSE